MLIFRPRLVPTLAACMAAALTASLALWQLNRADEKARAARELEARMGLPALRLDRHATDAANIRFRQVLADGVVEAERLIFVDNRVHRGQAGFEAMVPLRLADGARVLLNLGWLPRGREYPRPPAFVLPVVPRPVMGMAIEPARRYLEFARADGSGPVWQNLDLGRLQARWGIPLLPVVVASATPLGTVAVMPNASGIGRERHLGYAFQWGALTAAIVIIWIVTNVHRRPR
jgi:cytochrome oxidase assembly protein ShyY1